MTPEQITAIAREYAEEMIKGKPSEELPNCLKNSMLTMNTEYIAEVFQWLSRRFCLVEKKRVIAELKAVDLSIKASLTFIMKVTEVDIAKKELLHSLFPEIAKEVEDGMV